jgi:diaminopimelate decarboxylase
MSRDLINFEGVNILDALNIYGSPLFLLSEGALLEKYRLLQASLRKYFPQSEIAYSYKTNYLSCVCEALKKEGALAEVVSYFEYGLARKLGYEGSQIIFNGPLKQDKILQQALSEGALIHIDNREELLRIAKIAARFKLNRNIGIRINSRLSALDLGGWNRFGFNVEDGEAFDVCRYLKKHSGLNLASVHMHIGTNIGEPRYYGLAAQVLAAFVKKIRTELDITIDNIDVGGGFGVAELPLKNKPLWQVPEIDYYFSAIAESLQSIEKNLPKLIIEPGRFLVSGSMCLATSVVSTKIHGGTQRVICDASVSILPTARTHAHSIRTVSKSDKMETVIFGASCMGDDVLGKGVFPKLTEGDTLLIEQCGAYSTSFSSQFINPRPPVLWVGSDNKLRLAKRPETAEDLLRLDLW